MIEREDVGDVAVVRMARGPVNALDLELLDAIEQTFTGLADDPARAVVLTGAGRCFSAGVDLTRYLDGGEEYVAPFLPVLSAAFAAVFDLGKPVVAAINGHAIAGGCVLACCCDHRLMSSGTIGVPEIRVGVPFPRSALEILGHAVGEVAARQLVLGAQTYRAPEAERMGLVDEVVDADGLLQRAIADATDLADRTPADTFALTKRQLQRVANDRIDRYGDDEHAGVERLWLARTADGWTRRYLDAATGRS